MSSIRILFSIVLVIMSTSFAFGQKYLKDILFNGDEEKPHMVYSAAERTQFRLRPNSYYWSVNNNKIENEKFWGLLENDFYSFYDIKDVDLSSPLKRKIYEKTDEYKVKGEEMTRLRNLVLNETIHVPFTGLKYEHQYDVNKGGFVLECELPSYFPHLTEDNYGNSDRPKSIDSTKPAPDFITISNMVKKYVEQVYYDNSFNFFMPISNEEVALGIEETRNGGNYPQDDDYQFLLRLKYCATPIPSLEIVDIILYRPIDNQIVWSATTGDLSQNIKPIVDIKESIKETNKTGEKKIYTAVEQSAEFRGGQAALMRFLGQNIRYPEESQKNGVSGRVVVRFIVNIDGSISNATVTKGVDQDLDREALRVINMMPKWQPARNNGQPVPSYFNLPVTFRLQQ